MKSVTLLVSILILTLTANSQSCDKTVLATYVDRILDIRTGDIDGDGDLDIVSAFPVEGLVIWYENLGDGNFSRMKIVSDDSEDAKYVRLGDFDNDGDLDVLTATKGINNQMLSHISWYENGGSGLFSLAQEFSSTGTNLFDVCVADLDGDGDIDILNSDLYWHENNGNGNFGIAQTFTTDPIGGHLHAEDLDGDGDVDILSGGDNYVVWYENLGNGNYSTSNTINETASGTKSVYSADLDDDGDLDVLSASSGNDRIIWYENLGGGSFGLQQVITFDAEHAVFVNAADLDGDGDMDVLSASRDDNKISWYENDGNGNFGSQQSMDTSGYYGTNSDGWGMLLVLSEDMDLDGDMDVLYLYNGGGSLSTRKIVWFENDGNAEFGNQKLINCFFGSWVNNRIEDIDNDGDLDIISVSDLKVVSYENDGNGNFGKQQVITFTPHLNVNFHECDLDSDGDSDFILTTLFEESLWFENDGNGGFSSNELNLVGPGLPIEIVSVDWDSDQDLDLVCVRESVGDELVVVYDNIGNETFQSNSNNWYANILGSNQTIADLNLNGDLDIVVNLDGTIYWYENSEDYVQWPIHEVGAGSSYKINDIDGDGDIDVVFSFTDLLGYYLNDGVGNFGSAQYLSYSYGGLMDCFDYDEDGDNDILVSNDSGASWYINDGNANFTQETIVDCYVGEIIALDKDGDGDWDILSQTDEELAWYENQSFVNQGCMDPLACNYNTIAVINDDSCTYPPCSGCDGDLDGDGEVGTGDLLDLLSNFGCFNPPGPCVGDLNLDGVVNVADLLFLVSYLNEECE